MTDPAGVPDDPVIVLIEDEEPTMTFEEWLDLVATDEPVDLDAGAAEIIREIREHGERFWPSPTLPGVAATIAAMEGSVPRPKVWWHRKVVSEHGFDKLHLLDCTLAEFEAALEHAEVIEERELEVGSSKELLLLVDWKRPLHVVVVVDESGREERIVTVYEPVAGQWSADYRRRR